ncbi:MAG: transketolase [Solirubrobacteraceae bacterium]|nr:transketolase [Solirubrobacteraceae bacterium]
MSATGAQLIRRAVLEQSRRANIGHIGSSLSIVELLAVLVGGALDLDRGDGRADRDRFVLAKGHAVLAWYCALHVAGRLTHEQLETFACDGTLLAGHPDHALDDVDFSTGSLGQGLSIATGAALAGKRQDSARRIVVLVSDAECNEGSVWEAAMFAAQHGLDNLTAIVDLNGQQALGYTKDVLDLGPRMAERWRVFGWDAIDLDGHDTAAIRAGLDKRRDGRPRVLIAHTTFGKGVDYMESQIRWHYMPMDEAEYASALEQVG